MKSLNSQAIGCCTPGISGGGQRQFCAPFEVMTGLPYIKKHQNNPQIFPYNKNNAARTGAVNFKEICLSMMPTGITGIPPCEGF